jgi:hypothetical protein
VQVWDDQPLYPYSFSFSKPVTKVTFDPNNWILDGFAPRVLSVESAAQNTTSLDVRPTGFAYEIDFALAKEGDVSIEMYDLLGRTVSSVHPGWQGTGKHSIVWQPSSLAAGTYFCVLKSGGADVSIRDFQILK